MNLNLTYILVAVLALATVPGCATNDKQSGSKQKTEECIVKDGKLLDVSGKPMTGCVMMLDGKMMMMDGKLVPMKRNMTMPDGTICMVNGTCVMRSGAKRKLTEGEVLTPKGDIFRIKGLATPGAYF
jgi:Domain of unknown function (DUF6799)